MSRTPISRLIVVRRSASLAGLAFISTGLLATAGCLPASLQTGSHVDSTHVRSTPSATSTSDTADDAERAERAARAAERTRAAVTPTKPAVKSTTTTTTTRPKPSKPRTRPTPTRSSTTPARPAKTTAPPPPVTSAACGARPSASNTGAHGTRRSSGTTVLGNGAVLENANVSDLTIEGDNVKVRNVAVSGGILVTGDGVTIDHVTTKGIGISSASNVTVQYANIGFGDDDAIHVTSDRGRLVKNVSLTHNYIHDPRVSSSAHYDGTQVRGASGVTISCSNYDPGAYQSTYNAAVYLEDANGGTSNVKVVNNWLNGFGFPVMIAASGTQLLDNKLGGDIHWENCYVGDGPGNAGLVSRGNTRNGASINLCM